MANEHAIRNIETETGILTLEFDFIPEDPSPAQVAAFVPHTCDTCEWGFLGAGCHGKARDLQRISPCPKWEIGLDAFSHGFHEYLKDLHRRNYE